MATATAPEVHTPTQEIQEPSILAAAIQATQAKLPEVQMFELHQRQARLFATSGLFDDIKGSTQEQAIAQAFVKIDLGESIGLSAAEAMTGIDLIKGRVSISANIRAARMKTAGYDWDILQLDEAGCRLRMKYKGRFIMIEQIDEKTGEVTQVPAVVSFTLEDAKKAALAGKDNYKNYPRNMLFARAITNAQRWYAPEIFSVNVLSTEEAAELPAVNEIDEAATRKAVEEMAYMDKMFAELGTTATKITSIKGKHIGRNGDLIAWLEGQIAKKRNDGSKREPSAEDPSKTTPSTAHPTESGQQGGTPEKSAPSTEQTGTVENAKAEPTGDLFQQQDAKGPATQAKPVPPPVDESGW